MCQGRAVWRDGQLEVTRGAGRNVARPPRSEVFKAQDRINERTRPHPVSRAVSLHQTP